METQADTKGFDLSASNSSNVAATEYSAPPENKIKFRPDELYYDMSGKKLLVIFNHSTYDNGSRYYYNSPHKDRNGTEKDVAKLDSTFSKLGFTVTLHNNKDYDTLRKTLVNLRETDMSDVSCLCIAILTHGDRGGKLCAYDRSYDLHDVLKLFQTHPTLAGKPKLFFIQACRGDETDAGNRVAIDGDGDRKAMTIPSHADFVILRSTVEGENTTATPLTHPGNSDYFSYRDNHGSWMIQELCKAINEYHEKLDILHIVTFMNRSVAFNYATYTNIMATHNKRMMPETTFTLTKFLKF